MRFTLGFAALLRMMLAGGQALAADYQVRIEPALVYADHDGTMLVGDLYRPEDRIKAPVVVAFHGGAWRAGSRAFYKYWGPFLARNGYALFAIEYRLGKRGAYPAAVYDCKAAVQFVRARAADFGLARDRVGLMGDSAGGQLAALVALAGDRYTSAYQDDAHAATPVEVKAVVGFYGIYDMLAQWHHDVLAEQELETSAQKSHDMIPRPHENITEEFLAASPKQNPQVFAESSPITYATPDRSKVHFLLIHGSRDELVEAQTQTGAFLSALTRAGIPAQQLIIPEAGHFWASEPFENAPHSFGATAASQILRFLESSL